MAGKKKNKDHTKDHAGLALVSTILPPSDQGDPLRFWTLHATDATYVDLHPFAQGQHENPVGNGGFSPLWPGPFSGRPGLIAEMAPFLKARLSPRGQGTAEGFLGSLRTWWRLLDTVEKTPLPGGKRLKRVESVADLAALHESAAHQAGMTVLNFRRFRDIANDVRNELGLPPLRWEIPDAPEPDRQLISDDMARALRTALKANWRAVRKDWLLKDHVRAEANRRDLGETEVDLGPKGERLLVNWQWFHRASTAIGTLLPTGKQLVNSSGRAQLAKSRLSQTEMYEIQFPTRWDTHAALHMALMDSGWNLSTMLNLDASDPNCVVPSLKDDKNYLVLSTTGNDANGAEDEPALSMSAAKPRAFGKLQYCHGLSKNTCCAPVIVRAFIQRTEPLREVLREQLQNAIHEHSLLSAKAGVSNKSLGESFKRVQDLRRGVRSVWIYVSRTGKIDWIDNYSNLTRFYGSDGKPLTYLAKVVELLGEKGQVIGRVTPSDFRDLYARRFLRESNGSIIALMLALGHSSISSTQKYVDNNLIRAENDQVARNFLDHLFGQLANGRVDLTILAQLSRHGPLTPEMERNLMEYRSLMRSRLGIGCTDPRNPPEAVDPDHKEGRLCSGQRCSLCPNARFLPESLEGLSMRAEELSAISDLVPREAFLRLRFGEELDRIEALLEAVFPAIEVAAARAKWRGKIEDGSHRIPGLTVPPIEPKETA